MLCLHVFRNTNTIFETKSVDDRQSCHCVHNSTKKPERERDMVCMSELVWLNHEYIECIQITSATTITKSNEQTAE